MKITTLRSITVVLVLSCASTLNLRALELQSANATQGLTYASLPADPRILVPWGELYSRNDDHISREHFDDLLYPLSSNEWVAPGLRSAWEYLKHQLYIANKKLEKGEEVKPILTKEQIIQLNNVIDPANSEIWQEKRKRCLTGQDDLFAHTRSYIKMKIFSISYDQFVELNSRYSDMGVYDKAVNYQLYYWQNSTAPQLIFPLNTWQLRNIILSLPSWNEHNMFCQLLDSAYNDADLKDMPKLFVEHLQYNKKYCDHCQANDDVPQSDFVSSQLEMPYPSYGHYRAFEEILPELLTQYQSALEAAETPDDVLNAVADYTQKFIQLHPFSDANGRTFRMFASYVLMLHGFAPLSFDKFSPIPLTQEQWREKFKQAQWEGQSIVQKQLLPL